MAFGFSDFTEQAFLNHFFRPGTGAYVPPTTNYIALHDGAPGDTGANEVAGGSYARFAMTPATSWEAAGAVVARAIRNAVAVSFTGMPATTVTHASIWDASTGGNCLAVDVLAASAPVSGGGTVEFAINQLRVLFASGVYTDYCAEGWLDFMFRNQALTRPTAHNLAIYNGDPTGAGTQVSGSTLQAITFNAPTVSGDGYQISQNGAISFASLNADTCDYWLVQDTAGTPNKLAYRNQATLTLSNGDDVDFADQTVRIGID